MQTGKSLADVVHGGVIHEDVMRKIWDISPVNLPLQERIGSERVGNRYASWRIRDLAPVDPTSAAADGSDSTQDDTRMGNRVGNWVHIKRKKVATSTTADAVDTIGYSVEHTDQIMNRQKELRRDVESAKLHVNAAKEDDGSRTAGGAGTAASIASWLTSHTNRGTGGADGGFGKTTPGIVDAPTAGQARAGNENTLRDLLEDCYTAGGNPSIAMSRPKLIRRVSEYMFTSSARIANLQSDVREKRAAATATGAVNVFVTDFDVVLQLIPNRMQTTYQSSDGSPKPVDNLHLLDPGYLREGMLRGYRSDRLGKTGLSETSEITVIFTLKMLNEKAHALYADLDATQPWTAS